MPLYEYKCTECGSVTEAIQKVTDGLLKKCSFCGGPLVKLISSPAIQFKGSGWYVTDYGGTRTNKKGPKPQAKPDASKSKSEKKEEKSQNNPPPTPVR